MKAGLLAVALAVMVGTAAHANESDAPWPDGAKAAIVLTYDDALTSQLDNAVPALDEAGFKGTFYLSNIKPADVERWRQAAASGHELGNHTIFHACPASVYPTEPRNTSEAYTIPAILKEIEQQNVLLTALDGKARHGMATPCGVSLAGGEDYIDELRDAGLVDYVRAAAASGAEVREGLTGVDVMNVPARVRLIEDGLQLFSISFHSPSAAPGHTPYVRDAAGLDHFHAWWDGIFAYFRRRGITPASMTEIEAAAARAQPLANPPAAPLSARRSAGSGPVAQR